MTVTAPVCRGCGGPLLPARGPGRPVVWCSERCRKAQYSRPCADCGKPLNGSDGRGERAPVRCSPCQHRTVYERTSAEQCVEAVAQAARIIGHPPTVAQYRDLRREAHPFWPSASLVRMRCGSWMAAVRMIDNQGRVG